MRRGPGRRSFRKGQRWVSGVSRASRGFAELGGEIEISSPRVEAWGTAGILYLNSCSDEGVPPTWYSAEKFFRCNDLRKAFAAKVLCAKELPAESSAQRT